MSVACPSYMEAAQMQSNATMPVLTSLGREDVELLITHDRHVSHLPESTHGLIETRRERTSAPPPYTPNDPETAWVDMPELSETPASTQQSTTTQKKKSSTAPSLLLEVAVGYRMAKKLTEKRRLRKEARLERVHDAWTRLGLDTRQIMRQGGQLPPHFWDPPKTDVETFNALLMEVYL